MNKIDLERFSEYNDSYEFVDELYDKNSTVPIRLIGGKYADTIIKYNHIQFQELSKENDEATLKFEYQFIDNPLNLSDTDAVFNNYIGDILVNIIINTLNERDDEIRNDDTEELNSQRGIHSESLAVS